LTSGVRWVIVDVLLSLTLIQDLLYQITAGLSFSSPIDLGEDLVDGASLLSGTHVLKLDVEAFVRGLLQSRGLAGTGFACCLLIPRLLIEAPGGKSTTQHRIIVTIRFNCSQMLGQIG